MLCFHYRFGSCCEAAKHCYLLIINSKYKLKLALILITQSLGTFVFNNCLFPKAIIWTSSVIQVRVGVLHKVLYGTLHLKVHLLYTFVPFWKKKCLFCRSFIAKGPMFPFASLFKNTTSLYYSLGNKLDNVAESPHSGWREWMRAFQQHLDPDPWNLVLMTILIHFNTVKTEH